MENIEVLKKEDINGSINSLEKIKKIIKFRMNIGWHYEDSEIFIVNIMGKDLLLKLSIDKDDGDNLVGDSQVEINILKILKEEFIDKNITPCIIEVLYYNAYDLKNFEPDKKQCLSLNTKAATCIEETLDEIFCKYIELYNSKIISPKLTFLMLEICDKSLTNFLKTTDLSQIFIIKSFIFNIIYTIYIINKKFPSFHHADLHTQNVLLIIEDYVPDLYNLEFLEFLSPKHKFYVPFFGYWVKIIDFGFSSLEEKGIVNLHSSNKGFKYTRIKNDILWFFHDLYNDTHGMPIHSAIKSMLDALDPKQRYLKISPEYIENNSLSIQEEYKNLIENPLFNDYRNPADSSKIIKTFSSI